MHAENRLFRGWKVAAAAAVTYGIAQGIPYYNVSFFYDYFQRAFGWSRSEITLGFPIAALLTLWVGPLVVPRFSPRKLILFGTACTAAALAGFGWMHGALSVYFALWMVYTVGYITSGPIPHQLIVSHWFQRKRGTAMGIIYLGAGVVGSLGSMIVKPFTDAYGYRVALYVLAAVMFAGWPLVLWVLRDKASDCGLPLDGDAAAPAHTMTDPLPLRTLMRSTAFWLLLFGSVCSIGTVGAVSQHMKFIFLDSGYKPGQQLDAAWRTTSVIILISSTVGRLAVGVLADWWSTKAVMIGSFAMTAAVVPALLVLHTPHIPYAFAVGFGVAMGADYMLIPLMVAEEFGLSTLARAMSLLLPINTVAQTWFPYVVAVIREHSGSYRIPLLTVVVVAFMGSVAIMLLPRRRHEGRSVAADPTSPA